MRTETTKQVAKALGLAAPTLQKYAREGRIPFETTPGGHRRFNIEEVRACLFEEPRGMQRPALHASGLRIGVGSARELGANGAFDHAVRATYAGESHVVVEEFEGHSAINDLVGHARRLVGSSLR